ncbi:golgin subfamily A member 1-like isoform X2 [Periplaneta americana]|uniref:golgin subfamily A member 1-like isoform X2 n=1 Tax=Periplaneta americana TaxID=6978 RepID=UPI0037E7A94F
MFASLKNKIKEETGSDPTKLALSSPPQKILHGNGPKGRHSRQGSGSSVGSLSLDGVREELTSSPPLLKRQDSLEIKLADGKVLTQKEVKRLEKREDEWRRKLQKLEEEWTKKLEKKEEEWRKQMEEKQKDWRRSLELLEKEKGVLEEEKREIVQQKLQIEEDLKVADEYKKKVFQYQEDIDQLEGFQTQEMAKIKHLLLVKEQEVAEKLDAMKEASSQIENLKLEVTRLRRYEEELANLQELVGGENKDIKTRLIEVEKRLKVSETECAHLNVALEGEKSGNATLHLEVARLRDSLEAERTRTANLSISLDRERGEKDETLLRNAQVNQQVELAKQELREQEQESAELHTKIASLERKLSEKDKDIDRIKADSEELSRRIKDLEMVEHDKQVASNMEKELRSNISDLEEQLVEKNKNIRVLQQRLGDMKKTLQRELRLPAQSVDSSNASESDSFSPAAVLTPSSSRHLQQKQHHQAVTNHRMTTDDDDDVNFKYLKHVLIKFLTSREYEAQHLTRAVATLLRFSPEEERLLRETLEWKMSWFGTRPSLGFGQTAKTIPPS